MLEAVRMREALIPSAVKEVGKLYQVDQRIRELTTDAARRSRVLLWGDLAGRFPSFAGEIAGLGRTLMRADELKKELDQPEFEGMEIAEDLRLIEDVEARNLLSDIFLVASIKKKPKFSQRKPIHELQSLAYQIVDFPGTRSVSWKKLSLPQVIESVLNRRLTLP